MKHYIPRAYQDIATGFLLDNPRCNLFAKPGMGKTAATAAMLDILKLAGSQFFPALVLAPKRVAQLVWPSELREWDAFEGLSLRTILGTREQRMAALRAPQADIYTCNYDNIQWLFKQLNGNWPFKILIADESTRLKGFRLQKGAKRADALSDIAKRVGRWVNLTGTPAANGLTDLWGPQWFVDYGASLGRTWTTFIQEQGWFYENPYTHETVMLPGAQDAIFKAIAPSTLALRPEDWFTLEKPVFREIAVDLPTEARRIYREMEKRYFVELDAKPIEAVNAGVKTAKLLQLASGSIYDSDSEWHDVHDEKLEALESIVNELNEPLLVGYYFRFTPARVKRAFPKARIMQSEVDIIDWNAGKVPLMLVHYQSAGHGLSLQHGGRALCYFDQIWDGELREQVLERIGPTRQAQSGYKRVVLVWDLLAKSTMDHQAYGRATGKLTLQEALMEARARIQ